MMVVLPPMRVSSVGVLSAFAIAGGSPVFPNRAVYKAKAAKSLELKWADWVSVV
jgi:hypothetical protein